MAAVATRSAGRGGIRSPIAINQRSVANSTDTTLSWLSACKSADLHRVANAIGSNTGGTKALLCSRLIKDLQQNRFAMPQDVQGGSTHQPEQRIVSIDLGIRNLAFCGIKIPHAGDSCTCRPLVPIVYEWVRIALSKQSTPSVSSDDTVRNKSKETFDPATYAQHAYRFINQLLSHTQPTQILIERQRFRSMGGSAVQEWTLRVNMFEAMLYAVLHTFSSRNFWHGNVHPVLPAKVSKFWLGDGEEELTQKASSKKSSATKAAKIALAGKWIAEADRFRLDGEAAKLAVAYQRKRLGRKQVLEHDQTKGLPAGEYGSTEIDKLDDLADCLLQGMAWIQWERNRRQILAHGLQALEHR